MMDPCCPGSQTAVIGFLVLCLLEQLLLYLLNCLHLKPWIVLTLTVPVLSPIPLKWNRLAALWGGVAARVRLQQLVCDVIYLVG